MQRMNKIGEVIDLNAHEYYKDRLAQALKSQYLPENWRKRVEAMEIVFRTETGRKLIENCIAGRTTSMLLIETIERLLEIESKAPTKSKASDVANAMPLDFGFSVKERINQLNLQLQLQQDKAA